MRGRVLILEDDPQRVALLADCFSAFTVEATADPDAFWALAARGGWSLISLDFDLDLYRKGLNALEVVRRLGDPRGDAYKACAHTPVLVHSLNLGRAPELVAALWQWEGPVVRVPLHAVPDQLRWLLPLAGGG